MQKNEALPTLTLFETPITYIFVIYYFFLHFLGSVTVSTILPTIKQLSRQQDEEIYCK
jgi:hypothetical protein